MYSLAVPLPALSRLCTDRRSLEQSDIATSNMSRRSLTHARDNNVKTQSTQPKPSAYIQIELSEVVSNEFSRSATPKHTH